MYNGRVSVRLSDPAWAHSNEPVATDLLLWARQAGDINRLIRLLHDRRSAVAACVCGQCHVVSVSKKLHIDLFQRALQSQKERPAPRLYILYGVWRHLVDNGHACNC